jgi:hypothetical protein
MPPSHYQAVNASPPTWQWSALILKAVSISPSILTDGHRLPYDPFCSGCGKAISAIRSNTFECV